MRSRPTPAPRETVIDSCAAYRAELQRIVLRCVGDEAAATAVLDEAVARAARASLPPGPALRRVLFRLAHDVLLERRRDERDFGSDDPPSSSPTEA